MKQSNLIQCGIVAAGMLTAVTVYQNLNITVTKSDLYFENLPTNFDNYKIVLLSDIHSRNFGKKQKSLINQVKKLCPDIILITGDWVDSKHGNISNCVEQASLLNKIAPVWAIYGNHEIRIIRNAGKDRIHNMLSKAGVHFLHTSGTRIERGNSFINLVGIEDDVNIAEHARKKIHIESNKNTLSRVMHGILPDEFTILMAHHPEFFNIYSQFPVDLVLCGHAHGGQVRVPALGGLIAPGQGIFPRYTSGKHKKNHTEMVVSRGLGGFKPVRVFNQPEIVSITLKKLVKN